MGPGGAVLTTLLAVEPLKKSRPFGVLTNLLTRKIDGAGEAEFRVIARRLARHHAFVTTIEPNLRRLAEVNSHFAWLNDTLDWLQRHPDRDRGHD